MAILPRVKTAVPPILIGCISFCRLWKRTKGINLYKEALRNKSLGIRVIIAIVYSSGLNKVLIYCHFPGLAALVQFYVQAINSPGVIPNVQNAWEAFVEMKCSDTIKRALETYENVMKSKLKGKLPCDNDELRKVHGTAFETSEAYFMAETAGISTSTTETYLNKLKVRLKEVVVQWPVFVYSIQISGGLGCC